MALARPAAGGRRASLHALAAFVRKEVRHLLRDRQTLAILLFLPVAQVVLFGYAVRTDIREVRVAVVAPVPDAAVAALRAQLAGTGRYTLLPAVTDAATLDDAFRRGIADVGVILPSGVADRLRAGEPLQVLVVADASDPNTGTAMQSYVTATLADWQGRFGAAAPPVRVVPSVRMRYNPTLESVHLFVPGLVATILTLVTTLMTAISLSREKERGSWEVLLVSPLHPWQVIIGKVVPYLGLAMANVATVLLAARLVFGVPLRGSLVLLLAASVLFALVGLALGVLIAAVTRSQLAAMLAALGGTMLPNIMLSGLVFPLASLPTPLFVVSHLIPARWFIEIARGIMLKGAGVAELWPNLAVLGVMLVVLLAASIRRTDVRLA